MKSIAMDTVYRPDGSRLSWYAVGMNIANRLGREKWLSVLALCVAGTRLGGCEDMSDAKIEYASLAETRSMLMDKPGVGKAVDVRTPPEYAKGHIPGAMNLDLADVPATKDSIDPALAAFKYLVVYGADPGSGSARAMAKRFMTAGHKGVKCFAGGYAEWVGSGLKTEASASPAPVPAAPAR
jgi:rhodanese-related sulfurtransferase